MSTPSFALGSRTTATRHASRAVDNARFEELCSVYGSRIAAYVRKAFPRADAAEITQDTLRKAFRHQAHVLELDDPWPWLALTARNTAYNSARDEKSRNAKAEIPCAEIYASEPGEVSVEDRALLREQVSLAFRAMDALSKDQRALIELMVGEGLTVSEAGRRLGYAEATARQHLCRLRSRLRTRFASLGGTFGVLPLGLLRFIRRGAGRTMTLPATVSLAAGTTLTITAVVGGGLALLPSGADATVTTAYQTKTHAPTAHAAATRQRIHTQRVAATTPATHTTTAVAPETHVYVASHPTQKGRTAAGGLAVVTPLGTIYVGDDQQQSQSICIANKYGTCG